MKAVLVAATLLAIAPSFSFAASSGQLELETAGEFQRTAVTYNCGAQGPITVTYINADPNFLVVVPIFGSPQPMVFSSVIAASGVRYAAGKWIWWSKGNSADLYDTTLGDNAAPVTSCTQIDTN